MTLQVPSRLPRSPISANATGELLGLRLQEGDTLKAGVPVEVSSIPPNFI